MAQVQRPDGTIPRSGDTKSNRVTELRSMGLDAPPPENQRTRGTVRFYPKSGYALRWHAGRPAGQPHETLSQLMAVWGHFPHRKHKQPDDLSLHLWAGGIDWWTSVGYWPFTGGDRAQALNWAGSNAPHRVGESSQALHRPRANYIGTRDDALFLELTRGSKGGFRVKRQVLALPEQVWVIVDAYEDRRGGTARTVWLTDNDNAIEPVDNGNRNRYRITSRGTSDTLAVSVVGSTPPTIRVANGETNPMIGWIARRPSRPAPALVVETPLPSSWTANVAVLENNGTPRLGNGVSMSEWTSAHQWSLIVPMLNSKLEIRRNKDSIIIRRGNEQRVTNIALRGVTNEEQSYAPEVSAYREQKNLYSGRLDPVEDYRLKMTWLVLGLGLASLVFILLVCRLLTPRSRQLALALPVASWMGLNVWLHVVYF
ncbi:MAG: hypothetical protein HOK82_12585 [Rhodospirillaceae bacterium]|nr:hypothetical protein [Rhodospirillaceae bacterium]